MMTGLYYMLVSTFLINTVVQSLLLLIGTALIRHGRLTSEVLLAFMLYQGQLQNETMNLFNSYSSLIKSSGAGDKVFRLLDRIPPPPGTGSYSVEANSESIDQVNEEERSHSSVKLHDIHFVYPSRPGHRVLKGLHLSIPAGSTIALVGASGCGKSTIVALLKRFYDPLGGSILIDGKDLRSIDVLEHRRRIGVVTQDPVLFSGTILSNITYGCPSVTKEVAIEAAKKANAHDFISSFPDGYDTQVGERGIQLSGGQKQRIAIARAIVKNPSLLLLDEATSALDAESESVVQEALDQLLSVNKDMTTVVVAHRLRTVRTADSIAYIQDGQVAEQGAHEDLMRIQGGLYRKMVERAGVSGQLPDD
jgi:ABC-type multidrug transport system fused ATPase/permease subunit